MTLRLLRAAVGVTLVTAAVFTVALLAPPTAHGDRFAEAATQATGQYQAWLGSPRAPRSATEAIANPWLALPSMMEVEAQAAFAVANRYWQPADSDPALASGLSWYLQSRVVERLFDTRYQRRAHSTDGVRLFGGAVPWSFESLRRTRWAVLRREAVVVRRLPPAMDGSALRAATAFGALEDYLTWPVLQGALRALAATMDTATLTREHAGSVIGAAAGQDLTWFFDAAFDPRVRIDYAVTSLQATGSDGICAPSCVRTKVTVQRLGDGVFSGSAQPAIGGYESGAGVRLHVAFADGQSVQLPWDGRAAERTFEIDAPTAGVSARLDREALRLLDDTPLDHTRFATPQTNMPVAKWTSRWLVWLQDLMLACSTLL